MKTKVLILALVLVLTLSAVFWFLYPSGRPYVLSGGGDEVVVSRDKETMEMIIDCAITRNCYGSPAARLFVENRLFVAEKGTAVSLLDGFSFSPAKRIRILQGIHTGEAGWVSDRMLRQNDARG